jgi:hypothetical protein
MFGWTRKTAHGSVPVVEAVNQSSTAAVTPPEVSQVQYQSDQPITRRAQDRFNRAPFASRIAETIAKRNDPSSIVIGLYGPWGDGKTSVLEMMEEALKANSDVIVIRFNPWHFQSEELLLRGFFTTLAHGLEKSLPNLKEKAGEMLKKYGSLLSLGSPALGGAAKSLGETLSTIGLSELKKRIDALLSDSRKRLVILVDDIDRLDRDETHSIFKLVKLSASFEHTCYVLAFDDEVVSAALGQRYGAGGREAGRAFLEKIIQVPLHLPPASRTSLQMLAFEGVENALRQADISLEQSKIDAFVRHFGDGLEPKLETPRLAKLYANALSFALPLLKGEANIVDVMLIEGIRVFYPRLYTGIRDNPDMFLHSDREDRRRGLEMTLSPVDVLLEKSLIGMTKDQRERIKDRLLKPLFPRIGNAIYDNQWDNTWAKDQKICSSQYFDRFFTYGVPDGDVPDAQINSLITDIATSDHVIQRELLQGFVNRRSVPRLVSMLRERVDSMDQDKAIPLAESIARNADLLPRERGPMVMGGTMMQGGILISQLIGRVESKQRLSLAESILQIAEPVWFAMECMRWIRHSSDTPEDCRLLSDDGELLLKVILMKRIAAADSANPLYLQYPKDAPSLYWMWSELDKEQEIGVKLTARFSAFPEEIDAFLDTFVGEGWEIESGLPVRSSFERRNYDSVCKLISAEFILGNLRQRYGTELNNPQSYPDDQFSTAKKFAHQFVFIHNSIQRDVETGKIF